MDVKMRKECETIYREEVESDIEPSGVVRCLRSCCLIPQRYILALIGLIGVCNAFTMIICLNLAITQMVTNNATKNPKTDSSACPTDFVGERTLSVNFTHLGHENSYQIFEWDEPTQGFILSGFYYGYVSTQIPGGYLSERYGGKWTLGLGLLCTAMFTISTPVVVRAGGANWLFVLRVLQGVGEGPTIPGLMAVLARWAPPAERSMLTAIIFGGAQIGNIVRSYMSGVLLGNNRDWAYVFYFFGSFGILWFILWSCFCYSTPQTHPYISKPELNYLNNTVIIAENKTITDPIPWKAMLRSGPIWAIAIGMVGLDWGYYAMLTDLPKYATDVLKFNIETTGALTALPFLALWVSSWVFALICDYSINKGWHSIKIGRIIHTTIASTGPAICLVLASYSGCNRNLAMVYFVLSMAFMGGFFSGIKVNALDIAPNYSGIVAALVNMMSTCGGIILPVLVGYITPDPFCCESLTDCCDRYAAVGYFIASMALMGGFYSGMKSTLEQWRIIFWVCFVVLVGANIVYAVPADGKQQWWDDVRQYGYPASWQHGPLLPVLTEVPLEDNCDEEKYS